MNCSINDWKSSCNNLIFPFVEIDFSVDKSYVLEL